MKTLICLVGILFPIYTSNAQYFYDDFSDGNFTEEPTWTGNLQSFIINDQGQLQLYDSSAVASPRYLSAKVTDVSSPIIEWAFNLELDFSPSASNKFRFYLESDMPDFNIFINDEGVEFYAYYIEIGESGNEDPVRLYYEDQDQKVLIAESTDIAFSDAFQYTIKVLYENEEGWKIYSKALYEEQYVFVASGHFERAGGSDFFLGPQCFYTSSRSQLFYLDDIYFGPERKDTIAPYLLGKNLKSNQKLLLYFSETLDSVLSENPDNYIQANPSISIESIQVLKDSVIVSFGGSLQHEQSYMLKLSLFKDLANNEMIEDTVHVKYLQIDKPEPGDLIISEFMADPTPVVGLADAEYVEIYNRSGKYIDLNNTYIQDGRGTKGLIIKSILSPGQYLLITHREHEAQFSDTTQVIGLASWPSINNRADSLFLFDANGEKLYSLGYEIDWIKDEEKQEGGFSLEIINPYLACFEKGNWRASMSELGGSPGYQNSLFDFNFLGTKPQILKFGIVDSLTLVFSFDMSIKSADLSLLINESLVNVTVYDSLFELKVILDQPLIENSLYRFTLSEVRSCNGQIMSPYEETLTFDSKPPALKKAIQLNDSILYLTFNEKLSKNNKDIYLAVYGEQSDSEIYPISDTTLMLTLPFSLKENQEYNFLISGVSDLMGNMTYTRPFQVVGKKIEQLRYTELIISEFMVKPLNDQLLPNSEYVEIYNRSEEIISTAGLMFSDAKDTSALPLTVLFPNSFILLCPRSQLESFGYFGQALGLSPWPNLNNTGDELMIISQTKPIHQLNYDESWYKNQWKSDEGGWSIEIRDISNPCAGKSNWEASIDSRKGSPGKKNSIDEPYPDNMGPTPLNAYAPDVLNIFIVFDEEIHPDHLNYIELEFTPAVPDYDLQISEPNILNLQLIDSLIPGSKYLVDVKKVTDCVGNLSQNKELKISVIEPASVNDVVINELLFDPSSGGVDFLELYNRSDKSINLSSWIIKTPQSNAILPTDPIILDPYEYIVFTESIDRLLNFYPRATGNNIYELDLPNFPNISGEISLISNDSAVHQLFKYSEDLHLPFLVDTEGVSLERVSPEASLEDPNNWKSASKASGFGTPGNINSQYMVDKMPDAKIVIDPPSFSHIQQGRNHTFIRYNLDKPGYMGSIKIFDSRGRDIKTLVNNESLSVSGFIRWDGDNSQGEKVSQGYYIIFISLYSPDGIVKEFKQTVAVANK